jgi:hypothetical protein
MIYSEHYLNKRKLFLLCIKNNIEKRFHYNKLEVAYYNALINKKFYN